MKLIYTLFHFLGSVYFAIILIATTTLYVIGGTLLEAWTGSHLYAAQYTYSHPLFSGLLGFFFVNILFSALRRWPFKKKHVPFLITHLGLLMILSGVLIKNGYGTQGVMQVTEGSGSHQILIPNTHALRIEDKENKSYQFPKNKIPDLKVNIAGYTPHLKERWDTFIKGKTVLIAGLPLIPLQEWTKNQPWPESSPATLPPDENEWHILAVKTSDTDHALKRAFIDFENKPLLLILQDGDNNTSLWTFHAQESIYGQSFRQEDLSSLVVYDRGFSGYGVQAKIPLSQKLESLRLMPPPLQLFKEACKKNECPFEDTFISYIQNPIDSTSDPSLSKVLSAIAWSSVTERELQGCYWTALLLQQLNTAIRDKENLKAYLKKKHWPLIIPENDNPSDILIELAQQMFLAAPHLPTQDIKAPSNNLEYYLWMNAYLLAYGITNDLLLPPIQNEVPGPSITLETPMTAHQSPSPPSLKLEDNRPGIRVEVGKGKDKEAITLAYDPAANGLKWPILNGELLLRFQPEWKDIPYRVRLRQARQINYTHSQQTYSYESDVVINDEETTLSMNRVHQTWDGYRFYMSGMTTGNDNLKTVQIVVNHDPAKYFLTYPGGGVVGLGIILLFWGRRRR